MDIFITKADWGMEHLGDLDARMAAIADAGFDGIECFFVAMDPARFRDRCRDLGLFYNGGIVAPTVDAFRAELQRTLKCAPTLINCHGGRDYHTHNESVDFFTECMKIASEETDTQVVFETHRRCNLYAPWVTEQLLDALPDLRICADFSHFTVVSKGNMTTSVAPEPDANGMMAQMPDPRKEAMMAAAISRTDHIHARVGDLHRPQCVDPRIGEGLKWTELYEGWWDRILERAKTEGRPWMTINPEYGPVPYAPADPVTNIAISDPWELSVWAKDRLRKRYSNV
jgi:hypothetical protein